MTQKTVLVIDDSATIRRLVDTTLSAAGYAVVLAAGAEEGFNRALEVCPDLIILDHQLPGTTGIEVCRQLLAADALRSTPVIASSTLRKKAYVEYADCPNVVDMLPKPYTAELLVTTIANALDTATLVVDSQRQGRAVPEVLEALGDVALTGSFRTFSLRAVLDFLNNAHQQGILEVEAQHHRVWISIARGRVQAITANGINLDELTGQLPETLQDLAPVLRLTVGGGSCSQIEGLVQLLDNKVLDPRLLQKLLRHQAAMLLLRCFTRPLLAFRFDPGQRPPALHERLSLDISVAALLVEACLAADSADITTYGDQYEFSRKAIRGQNLDRAGLSAQHQKVLSHVNEGITLQNLTGQVQIDCEELQRVLCAFALADLVEAKSVETGRKVVVLETDPQTTLLLREAADRPDCPLILRVVRDRLSLQLVLKRQHPDVIAIALDSDVGQQVAHELAQHDDERLWVGIVAHEGQAAPLRERLAAVIRRPYGPSELIQAIEQAWSQQRDAACVGA